jgi:peptidoglycan/LPS O-acetylase OafA/YrhL
MLDGFRGIAALVVLAFHTAQSHGIKGFPFGALAVDFFFLLSGFILAHAYERKLAAGLGNARYLAIRLIRIYPLALAGMLLGLAITLARVILMGDIGVPEFLSVALSSILMLPSFALPQYETAFPANLALWSIFFELVASAAYLVVARQRSNRALVLLMALAAAALVWSAATLESMQHGMNREFLHVGLFRATFGLFAGVLIFRLHPARAIHGNGVALGLLAAFAAVLLVRGEKDAAVDLAIVMLFFPAVLVLGTRTAVSGRFAAFCRAIGILSFPLYAVHIPVLRASAELQRRLALTDPAPFMVLEAVASIALALLLHRLYDVPVRRFLLGRLEGLRPDGATAPDARNPAPGVRRSGA